MYQRREYFSSSLMYRQHWLQFTRLKTFSNLYSFIWLICNTILFLFGFHIRQSLSSVFSFDGTPHNIHIEEISVHVLVRGGGPEVSGMFLFLPPWAFFFICLIRHHWLKIQFRLCDLLLIINIQLVTQREFRKTLRNGILWPLPTYEDTKQWTSLPISWRFRGSLINVWNVIAIINLRSI